MPNWCQNNLTIEHEDRAKVMEFVHAYKEGKVCDHYMPVPRDEKGEVITDESSPHYWYTWCINNWGTKWDVDPTYVDLTDNKLSLSYDTAWSPADAVWEAVTVEFPSLLIQVNYLEEGMGFVGKTWYQGGEKILDEFYESIPEEMYVSAGATLDKDGKIDWDEDQTYNLFDVFDDEKFFTVSK